MAWDESKHPRDRRGRFTDAYGAFRQNSSYREILKAQMNEEEPSEAYTSALTEDESLPRSVGAKWANYDIRMPDGTTAKFLEGAKLEHKEVIAGYGCRRKIDIIDYLVTTYPDTASTSRFWSKLKGVSDIVYNGDVIRSEIHWYEHPKTGKVDFKFKRKRNDEG